MQAEVNRVAGPELSVYRRLGARLFDRAIQETGLTPTEMRAELRTLLLRPTLTAPTLRAWRRGSKPTPLAAFLAVCHLAKLKPDQVFELLKQETRASELDEESLRLLGDL